MLQKNLAILLIEDNPDDIFFIQNILQNNTRFTFSLQTANRLTEAYSILNKSEIDIILLDLKLPDSAGLDTYKNLHNKFPGHPVIILSGDDDEKVSIKAVANGAQDYIFKNDLNSGYLIKSILYAIERWQITRNLKTSLSLLDTALDSTVEGLIAVNNNGDVNKINNITREVWRLPKEIKNITGFNQFLNLIKNKVESVNFITKAYDFDQSQDILTFDTVTLKDGRTIEIKSKPQYLDNAIVGRVWSFYDVSHTVNTEIEIKNYIEQLSSNQEAINRKAFELFQVNKQLQESEEQLYLSNKNKDKFFSIIAHDLKSPFTTLIGMSELLLEDYKEFSEEEKIEFISSINATSKDIFNLLENLLDWSRLQSGKFDYIPEKINIRKMTDSVMNIFRYTLSNKKIRAINNTVAGTYVNADSNMINTIFRNLISNAIKFTNPGGTITLDQKDLENGYEFSVSDTGIGIPKDKLENLFKSNKSQNGTADEKGTGLGLYLCNEMVNKHSGYMRVESEEKKGTSFIFYIPIS